MVILNATKRVLARFTTHFLQTYDPLESGNSVHEGIDMESHLFSSVEVK